MQPQSAFCNWQFKVAGYDPDSTASESILTDYQVYITVTSVTLTSFSLVSANNKDFDFGQEGYKDGSYSHEFAQINLLRFAELEPHLVVAG